MPARGGLDLTALPRTPVFILLAAALLWGLPALGLPAYYDSLFYLVLHWVVLATSWNLLSGTTGYFSFGHGAFFGAGLYTAATLMARWNWPFLATLPLAGAVAGGIGLALGAVVFRVRGIRGEVFALLTLAVTFVLATLIVNTPLDGGNGVSLAAVDIPPLGATASATFYRLALIAATLTLLVAWALSVSRLGAGLAAIHDDEDAAEVMGVPTYRAKLAAMTLSCALAGVAGGIHALFLNYVTAGEVFNITVPLTVVLMSVLGGARHWAGPALGALVITLLLYSFTAANVALAGKAAVGAVLVAAVLFMPEGILPRLQRAWARRAAARPDRPLAAGTEVPARTGSADEPSSATVGATAGAPTINAAPWHPRPEATGRPTGADAADPVLLRVHGLAKQFRGVRALDGVDLDVRRGEILGLLGPNGSGKSTFINLVSGHFVPSAGRIRFEGRELAGLAAHHIARAGIARTYQIPRPFTHQSVLDNVALAAMYGGGLASPAAGRAEALTWLRFAGLEAKAHAPVDALNLHERKFLELARALASRPRLVLLDEVLCGLTPSEMDEAVALVRRIRDQGATVVFVEHVMRAVMALTDRVVVFDQGRLLAEGPPAEVMARPEVMRAYLGTTLGTVIGSAQGAATSQPAAASADPTHPPSATALPGGLLAQPAGGAAPCSK